MYIVFNYRARGDATDTKTMDNDDSSSLDGSAEEAKDVCNTKCMLQNSTFFLTVKCKTTFNSQKVDNLEGCP